MKTLACETLRRGGGLLALRVARLRLKGRPALFVLAWHRVQSEAPAAGPRSVTPAEFERQARFLARRFEVWPLSRVAQSLNGGPPPRRDTVALTFDDGYLDNHTHAAPVLERLGLPATFFVCTGPLLRGGGYWWDGLAAILEGDAAQSRTRLAAVDRLVLAGGLDPILALLLRRHFETGSAGGDRPARSVLEWMKRADDATRRRTLAALRGALFGDTALPAAPLMHASHVRDLAARGFEIGGHTVTHPVLSRLQAADCHEEIRGCLADLADLGIRATSFAYPFGDRGTVGETAPRVLAESGVTIAVTTEERAVSRRDQALLVPRKVVSRQTIGRIAARLERLAWVA